MSEHNSNMGNEDNGQQSNNNNNVNNSSNGTNRGGNANNHGRLEVRFLVCSRDAGAIIGKKGSNIQSLRQKHKVIIQVPDCDVCRLVFFVLFFAKRNFSLGTRTCFNNSR